MDGRMDDGKNVAVCDDMTLSERFKKYNVLFATNGDPGADSPLNLSMDSYADCVSEDNFMVLRSENGRCYGGSAFLRIFEHGIERRFDYLIYIDADCFITHSSNLYSLFKDFVESGCILGGPSDGGIFCHRSVNRFSINPFLMFVDLKKVSEKFRKGAGEYSFNGSDGFSEEKVTDFSMKRWTDTFNAYRAFREKNCDWFKVPHADLISKPHNEFEAYYGKGQKPWTYLPTTDFEPYYNIFLGMHDGEENVYFMYGRDYLCKADPSGITSAIYLNDNILHDSKLVCIHAWFTRFSNSEGGPFERMTRRRMFSVGMYALEVNGVDIPTLLHDDYGKGSAEPRSSRISSAATVYERRERFSGGCPMIHDADETIEMLATTERSISRLGDGELFIAFNGASLPFQCYNDNLAFNLKNILKYPTEQCAVALPHPYFYKTDGLRSFCENYIEKHFYGNMDEAKLMDGIDCNTHYYDTNFGIFYHHYDIGAEKAEERFNRIKDIIREKKLLLVTGDRKIENYEHNIFNDSNADVKIVYSEPKNAFLKYSTLRRNVLDASDGRMVVAICGPCATVLSYDISNNYGLRCLDMGHFAKEYNFFKSGLIPYSDNNEPVDFFTT